MSTHINPLESILNAEKDRQQKIIHKGPTKDALMIILKKLRFILLEVKNIGNETKTHKAEVEFTREEDLFI